MHRRPLTRNGRRAVKQIVVERDPEQGEERMAAALGLRLVAHRHLGDAARTAEQAPG